MRSFGGRSGAAHSNQRANARLPKASVERASAPKMGSSLRVEDLVVHQQSEFVSGGLAGADAPPVHAKAAGQRHDELFLSTTEGPGIDDLRPPFAAKSVIGLKFE